MKIGEKISEERHKAGITGEALAEKTHVTSGMIYRIESGRVNPSLSLLNEIAFALGKTLPELMQEVEL